MDQTYAYNIAVVFCYIVRDDQVLLIRRTAPPEADKYTVVGGKKERGESLAAACRREVLEETGLAVGEVSYRGVVSITVEGAAYETLAFYYLTRDFNGEPVPSGEGALEWCGIADSFHKEGISDYYVNISPYVLDESRCFSGSAVVGRGGELLSLDIV